MPMYRITCHCTRCGNKWRRTTRNPESPDPPCPNLACGEVQQTRGIDLSLSKAPASIGGNISIKAIDETARVVMEDYGMSDLRSDVRPGETSAPKLPPKQQLAADNFFNTPKGRGMGGVNLARHARSAMAGSLRDAGSADRTIGAVHRARVRPPVHIVGDHQG